MPHAEPSPPVWDLEQIQERRVRTAPRGRRWVLALVVALVGLGASESPRPNVVVVVLDTVRADAIGARLGGRPVTPFLDGLLEKATHFTSAYATAPWTVPTHASLFTGLLPEEHGARHEHFRLDGELTTMAESLRSHGYATAGFSCNPWIRRQNGFSQGFDRYDEVYRTEPGPREKGGAAATHEALEWVRQRPAGRPFFLFVNYLEAHLPYEPPLHVLKRLGLAPEPDSFPVAAMERYILDPGDTPAEELARARELYLAEVSYVDELMERLWAGLTANVPAERVALILVADHGEHLGAHGLIGHEFTLFEPVVRIPLAIYYPRSFRGERVEDPVSLVDVFPTVRRLAGLPPGTGGPGRYLGDRAEAQRTIRASYARPVTLIRKFWSHRYPQRDLTHLDTSLSMVRRGRFKLIRYEQGTEKLFDLEADPQELHDLSDAHPAVLESLRAQLPAGSKP